ncbi:MAG: MgtC/SapB family protein [Xanthobacteraceae bacterium]|nr:MgtC/SapB family protein [Xanthobacteraceae bacterium]
MLEWSEILLRLVIATLASGLIGLNRDLHGKPIGVRTLGLVGLSCATVVIAALPANSDTFHLSDATSRVIQGILTGVGFLGSGVIFHIEQQHKVRGLTSAACVWFTACIGVICGAGRWQIVATGLAIAFVLLIFGGRAERSLHKLFGAEETPPDSTTTAPP